MFHSHSVRRVVTGHDANGKAVFVSDEWVDPVTTPVMPGSEFHLLWGGEARRSSPTTAAGLRSPPTSPA